MWHVGIDLHRETVVMAAVNDAGEAMDPLRIRCEDTEAILRVVQVLGTFRAVIEASGTYRWLYDLLRIDQIPLAYIPPQPYQQLRDLTRCRPRWARGQTEVLQEIHCIGLYSALLIVAELGEVERFRRAKQVGAYAGLTSRVHQSGNHCFRGSISRQGSPWLRWILVEAAMKAIHKDGALKNFYTRVRKRSSAKIARVAVARKLAEICWKRLRRWQREHANQAA